MSTKNIVIKYDKIMKASTINQAKNNYLANIRAPTIPATTTTSTKTIMGSK